MMHSIVVPEDHGLYGLGQEPAADAPPSEDMFAKLSEILTFVRIDRDGNLTSNPPAMRAVFAKKYLPIQNYGDFRVNVPPAMISQWVREAEQQIAGSGQGGRSLVNEIKDKLKGVPGTEFVTDLLNNLQNFPDRLVYSKDANKVIDSPEWQNANSKALNIVRIASDALKSVGSFFGANIDIKDLATTLVQAIFFVGDYVREQYKAELELAVRNQARTRYRNTVAAYKAAFGFEPSWSVLSAWGRSSDTRALPDGTTGKYLDDKAAFDAYTARYASTATAFNVQLRTGNAGTTNDLRVATVLMFDLAKAYKLNSFKDVVAKFRSPGGGTVAVEINDLARPSGKNDLVRIQKFRVNDDWYMPWWEDTIGFNYRHDEQDRAARRRADQLALSDRFWKLNRNDIAAGWFMPFYNSIPGNDDDKWRWLNANYDAFMARIGGASPEQIAIFFASGGRWEKPVAPVKGKATRCPGGGTACLPNIVGRMPIGAKELPDLPKLPKQMSQAERVAFITKLRQAGFPDYYIEAIMANPSDWYEGVPAGSGTGLAGLVVEGEPFYKQPWYWLAVAGVVGVFAYRKYAR